VDIVSGNYQGNQEHGRSGMNYTGWNVQQWSKSEKKSLESLLQRMLPRRIKGIERSSYFRHLRVKLLTHNPYFSQDVSDLRTLFHIPAKQITDIDLSQFTDRKSPWDKNDTLDSEDAAGFWLEIHRHHFLKAPLGDWVPPLPQWFTDSAHILPVFGENAQISWLKKEPSIPERFIKYFNLVIPLDRCIARLIERYQLPWLCGINLRRYIMTRRVAYLRSIFPYDIEINYVTTGIGEAFTITVDGIDEFMTKQHWNEIFNKYIQLQQQYYWERRGEKPHSRQIDLDRRKQPWVFEINDLVYKEKMAGRKCGIDRALELLSKQEKLPPDGVDRKTASRLIKSLNILFQPCD